MGTPKKSALDPTCCERDVTVVTTARF